MALSVTKIWDSSVDGTMMLSNHEAKYPAPTGWTTLRIGCLIGLQDVGGTWAAGLSGSVQICFGLMYGDGNGPLQPTYGHCLYEGTSSASIGYVGLQYWNETVPNFRHRYASTTDNYNVVSASSLLRPARTSVIGYQPMVVEFTKGSPWVLQCVAHSSTTPVNETGFDSAMTADTLSGVASALTDHVLSSTQNVTVDEGTNGNLDHIFLAWDRTFLELYVKTVSYAIVA